MGGKPCTQECSSQAGVNVEISGGGGQALYSGMF